MIFIYLCGAEKEGESRRTVIQGVDRKRAEGQRRARWPRQRPLEHSPHVLWTAARSIPLEAVATPFFLTSPSPLCLSNISSTFLPHPLPSQRSFCRSLKVFHAASSASLLRFCCWIDQVSPHCLCRFFSYFWSKPPVRRLMLSL